MCYEYECDIDHRHLLKVHVSLLSRSVSLLLRLRARYHVWSLYHVLEIFICPSQLLKNNFQYNPEHTQWSSQYTQVLGASER